MQSLTPTSIITIYIISTSFLLYMHYNMSNEPCKINLMEIIRVWLSQLEAKRSLGPSIEESVCRHPFQKL